MNQNNEQTNPNLPTARPEDDAYNIQRECSMSHTSAKGPCSNSPSPMNDSSPPSEIDYAERVATNCNMDVEVATPSLPPGNVSSGFTFSLPLSNPRAPLEEAFNSAPSGEIDVSSEPSPPLVIPYSSNVPANPSLWDGNFTATSLFGTNEFLISDINNITWSLQRMACFLRQWNLEGRNANNIRQLEPFGESAWDFISAIFESGWDVLTTSSKSSIRSNIASEFGKRTIPPPIKSNPQYGIQISKIPPPIPPRPSKKSVGKGQINPMKLPG